MSKNAYLISATNYIVHKEGYLILVFFFFLYGVRLSLAILCSANTCKYNTNLSFISSNSNTRDIVIIMPGPKLENKNIEIGIATAGMNFQSLYYTITHHINPNKELDLEQQLSNEESPRISHSTSPVRPPAPEYTNSRSQANINRSGSRECPDEFVGRCALMILSGTIMLAIMMALVWLLSYLLRQIVDQWK